MKKVLTLCIIHKDFKILLGMKKRGFGVGKWNGVGGKVKEGENITDAAIRETKEEIRVLALNPEKAGVLHFKFPYKPSSTGRVYVEINGSQRELFPSVINAKFIEDN